jgi:hypothetical protein
MWEEVFFVILQKNKIVNMDSLVIQIKDNKVLKILNSLKDIDLISFIEEERDLKIEELRKMKPKNPSSEDVFFDLVGIWKNRDIDINIIRNRAWPKRK